MSLSARATTGILWNFGQQLANRGVGILVTLLLARFLVPEDFGLVAMMAVFLALGSSLMDSGFREALIRQENITQEDYATAFYANMVLGLVSYGALFAAAPAIAGFYAEPRLVDLIRVASLSVIIMSFGAGCKPQPQFELQSPIKGQPAGKCDFWCDCHWLGLHWLGCMVAGQPDSAECFSANCVALENGGLASNTAI